MAANEEILVVARRQLLTEPVQGFSTARVEQYLLKIRTYGMFRPRASVEHDPSLKQIIPYLIVRRGSRIFLFQRFASGGEPRLHGKYSIGVGGHINRADVEGAADIVEAGLRRELEEELAIDGPWRARVVGVLNDDTNPVGRVHFGLVHVVEVETLFVAVRESDALSGRLVDREEAVGLREQMETWSQLILDAADPMTL